MESLEKQLHYHQDYFNRSNGIPLETRITTLKKMKAVLKKYENDIESALKADLGKSSFEAFATEVGFLYYSINHTLKKLHKWAKVKKIRSEMAQFVGSSYIYPSAYGVVLIIGPFNYPVQLLLEPLIAAIASGNVAMLKPSELTSNVETVIVKLIAEVFDTQYVSVVIGDAKVSEKLLTMPFDYIFFTGSPRIGKLVMQKAGEQLIPVTLELGGKSPVIVDKSAVLTLAAERIAVGKFMNAGQTCVAPDYVLVHESVYDEFLTKLSQTIHIFYGDTPKENDDFGRIVNSRHTDRLIHLVEENRDKLFIGGETDLASCYVAPTVFKDVTLEDSLMADEIFGPLLPVIKYQNADEIDKYLQAHPKPLALYVFSENSAFSEQILRRYQFGGGCVNDTITHVASVGLPFGGVGTSGLGRYHGEAGFKTFTYEKSIVKRSTRIAVPLLSPPYGNKLSLLKKVLK